MWKRYSSEEEEESKEGEGVSRDLGAKESSCRNLMCFFKRFLLHIFVLLLLFLLLLLLLSRNLIEDVSLSFRTSNSTQRDNRRPSLSA